MAHSEFDALLGKSEWLSYILPALRQFAVPIDSLVIDPNNTRIHNERSIEALRLSLEKFGQRIPIIVQEQGMLVRVGNGRVEAARQLGWAYVAALIVDESDVDATQYALADNRTAEFGEWDPKVLEEILGALAVDVENFSLESLGFAAEELKTIVQNAEVKPVEDPGAQIDRAEELCKKWKTERGQVWAIPSVEGDGVHRLMCGDSTSEEDVGLLMGGVKVDALITDPPYGKAERTQRASAGRGMLAKNVDYPAIIGDDVPFDPSSFVGFAPLVVLFGANWFANALPIMASWVIWDKRVGVKSDDNADCELVWTNRGGPARVYAQLWKGCIRVGEDHSSRQHPTQKPVELFRWLIKDFPRTAVESVADLFLGSGTTMVAAEQLGCVCYGMEIDPGYTAVALQRMADMGLKPTLV